MRHVNTWVIILLLIASATTSRANAVQDGEPIIDNVEAHSLLGEPLRRPEMGVVRKKDFEAKLARAEHVLSEHPDDEGALIWVGRRLAYLGRYREAIEFYTTALEIHPDSYRLRRHRGHRYLTTRQLDKAVDDLTAAARLASEHADEIEPDGLPNARNTPTGTDKTNIYYHLALAHYLKGNFEPAADAWQHCIDHSKNPDMYCAAAYWRYLCLRRLNHDDEATALLATVTPDMALIENMTYHKLLLFYKGDLQLADLVPDPTAAALLGPGVDNATLAYGLASWYRMQGQYGTATRAYQAVRKGPAWSAFGYLAAEAELAREQDASRPAGDS